MNKIIALILLVLAAPLLLIGAGAVGLTSSGPMIYRQQRLGKDGRLFWILKLRTMRLSGIGDRRTRVGKWLRATSIDELPQLINVLRGEMRLIGPRPEQPHLAVALSWLPGYRERTLIMPGMTGWAQVHGFRGATSMVERVRYDLDYAQRESLWLNLKICLMTGGEICRSLRALRTAEAPTG